MKNIRSLVMTIANRLVSNGMNRAKATIKAWVLAKSEQLYSRVAGVTFEDRQETLKYIASNRSADLKIVLKREVNNSYDVNAVSVWVQSPDKLKCKIGYLPRPVSYIVAMLLDKGEQIQSGTMFIVGGYSESKYSTFGARIQINL